MEQLHVSVSGAWIAATLMKVHERAHLPSLCSRQNHKLQAQVSRAKEMTLAPAQSL